MIYRLNGLHIFFAAKIIVIAVFFSGCANEQKMHFDEKIKKQIALMKLDLENSKKGVACKYIGFIGDNSVVRARENGKIKFVQFNYTYGDFFKKCTYAFGK